MSSISSPPAPAPRLALAALAIALLAAPHAASSASGNDAPRPAVDRGRAAPQAAAPNPADPPFIGETVVVRPERPPAPTAPLRPGERISLSLHEADLVEVLRSFARLGGFDLIVHPAVRGTVTVELRDVEWQLALAVILRSHGLAAEIDGEVVAIGALPVAPPRR